MLSKSNLKGYIRNPKVQQYGLELVFPLVGYLFFDWTLLIIIVFYLIDQFGAEVAFWFRLKHVIGLYKTNRLGLFYVAVLSFVFVFTGQNYWLYHVFMTEIYDCANAFFFAELIEFSTSELWLLFPVLMLMHYLKDKFEFYKTDLPFQNPPQDLLKYQLIKNLMTVGFTVLLSMLWVVFKFHDLWILMVIGVSKVIFDGWVMPAIGGFIFKKN